MTKAELQRLGLPLMLGEKKSKYKNKKTKYDGIKFDSQKECETYKMLKILENNGKIQELKVQVPLDRKSVV